jgi:hypothetical protein
VPLVAGLRVGGCAVIVLQGIHEPRRRHTLLGALHTKS